MSSQPATFPPKCVRATRTAVRNETRPGSLVIIGAGAVGVEFADVYNAYGTQVTLLEALPRIVPIEDEEVSTQLARILARRKIEMKTGVKVQSVTASDKGVRITTDGGTFDAEQVLMAVGRAAKVKEVGLEALGVTMERNFVKVSPNHCTFSCSIFQENAYTPGVMGAVAVNVNVAFAPTFIGEDGKATRPRPQVVLSCGFWEPKRYGLAPVLVQTLTPLLFIVIEAVKVWPVETVSGTLLLTGEA